MLFTYVVGYNGTEIGQPFCHMRFKVFGDYIINRLLIFYVLINKSKIVGNSIAVISNIRRSDVTAAYRQQVKKLLLQAFHFFSRNKWYLHIPILLKLCFQKVIFHYSAHSSINFQLKPSLQVFSLSNPIFPTLARQTR